MCVSYCFEKSLYNDYGGEQMKLVKRKCTKEQYKNYYDLFLCFEHEGKKYEVLVRPCFWSSMPLLETIALNGDK